MTLNPGLTPLAPMIGTWDCLETYHAGGFSPKEVTAKGTDVLVPGAGGNAIVATYDSNGSFGPYFANDLITWDSAQGRFQYLFIDSFSPQVQLHSGKAEGERFVFEGAFELNGKKGTLRRTYSALKADSNTLTVDFIAADGTVTKLVTIQKTRRK